jgi:uncharacterized protein involved in tolerance to divalent cations
MCQLKLDRYWISGLSFICISMAILVTVYVFPPYHYPAWLIEQKGVLDNILTSLLFLGIGVIFARLILQQAEIQRQEAVKNILCDALSQLMVFTYMRIAKGDFSPQPFIDDSILWNLYLWGGEVDATSEMTAVLKQYDEKVSTFSEDIISDKLDFVPRAEHYYNDTADLRQLIKNVYIPMAIATMDDVNVLKELRSYAISCANFEAEIKKSMTSPKIHYITLINENKAFLEWTRNVYSILNGKRRLRAKPRL